MPSKIFPHPELARVSAHVEGRMALLPALRPTPREIPQSFEIATDERFLLGAAPALHLAFGGYRIGDVREFLMKDQHDWTPPRGVATEHAGVVLCDARLEVRSRG